EQLEVNLSPLPSNTSSEASSSSLLSGSSPQGSSHSDTDSSSQSSKSSSQLSPEAVKQLRLRFTSNFNDYQGTSWLLPTGTNVDDLIYGYAITLKAESSLHSFIIDDIDIFKSQLTAEDYGIIQEELQLFNSTVPSPILPTHIQNEILKYSLPPDELQVYLSKEWNQDEYQGEVDFRRSLYLTMLRLSCLYEENQGRSLETRHAVGSKLDGLISCDEIQHEIASIEMGKKGAGAAGTKSLGDGVKLAKDLKDMYDNICTQCYWTKKDELDKLRVFGLLISGLRVEFITLCRAKGRLYRLWHEETISIPSKWTEKTIRKY
ncbi:hypothetical protein BGX27_001625, partial [Mortierella sp. AM989]